MSLSISSASRSSEIKSVQYRSAVMLVSLLQLSVTATALPVAGSELH